MPDRPRNIGASVRQRLLNLAHARGQPMELLLTRYALERLLHRLSVSPHRERFVLRPGCDLLHPGMDHLTVLAIDPFPTGCSRLLKR
jgi:hypothetical protein